MPHKDWEKTLLQGYMNKLEGLIKPGEQPIDFAESHNIKMLTKQVHHLNKEAFSEGMEQFGKQAAFNMRDNATQQIGKSQLSKVYGLCKTDKVEEKVHKAVPKKDRDQQTKNKKKLTNNLMEAMQSQVKTRILDTLVKFLQDAMNVDNYAKRGLE